MEQIGCRINKAKSGFAEVIKSTDPKGVIGDLPEIGNGSSYKYLGLEQDLNVCKDQVWERVSAMLIERTEKIFDSKLNVRQMITAYNCMVPAVIRFIWTNVIIGRGKWSTDRLTCLRLDQKVRGILAKCKLRFTSQNTYRIYAYPRNGGLGLKSLAETFDESIVYAYCYLTCSQRLRMPLRFMEALDNRTKRSLVSDFKKVVESYGINCTEFPDVIPLDKPGLFIAGNCYEHPTIAARVIVKLMRKVRDEGNRLALDQKAKGFTMMSLITDYKRWNLDPLRTWDWIKKGFISPIVLRNVTSAQENNMSFTNFSEEGKAFCRWGCLDARNKSQKAQESIAHIVANCDNWASTIYVERHNFVASRIYYELCRKFGLPLMLDNQRKQPVVENEQAKLYWDRSVDCVKVNFNKPDIVCFVKKSGSAKEYLEIWVIEISVVWYQNLLAKDKRKFEKYAVNSMEIDSRPGPNLRGELEKTHKCPVRVIPIVVGVFGEISNVFMSRLEQLHLPSNRSEALVERISRSAVLGTHWVLKAHMSR